MMDAIQAGNLLVRFLVELAMVGLLAIGAWRLSSRRVQHRDQTATAAAKVGPAMVAGAVAVVTGVIWALVVHGPLPEWLQLCTQAVLFAAAAATLMQLRSRVAAGGFVGVVVANAALMGVWGQ